MFIDWGDAEMIQNLRSHDTNQMGSLLFFEVFYHVYLTTSRKIGKQTKWTNKHIHVQDVHVSLHTCQ